MDPFERAAAGFAAMPIDEAKKQAALRHLARWLSEERFATWRPTVAGLIERGDYDLLLSGFFQVLPFGTGGLRGPVGVGPNCINPWTLATSVQGHGLWLRRKFGLQAPLAVVVGFDVRVFLDLRGRYAGLPNPLHGIRSRDFARLAACVYAANGLTVHMPDPEADEPISTPELSFAIRRLGAQGGLNVSASHNHPDDNGGKFYDERGGQEVPPDDEEFARMVEGIDDATLADFAEARSRGLIRRLELSVHDEYVKANLALATCARGAVAVLTNLHGTGDATVGETLVCAGVEVRYVESQRAHDGRFPGVPFRIANPEVPESMAEATALARRTGADLALATDPDADRIGLVVPGRGGDWVFLTGNEIGALVTEHRFAKLVALEALPARPLFVTTEVTSRLPGAIARGYGAHVIDDLPVGCKYIAHVLRRLEESGRFGNFAGGLECFVLGLEESHGILVSPQIRDKDAAGAALLLAERAAEEKARGRTLFDVLLDLFRRVGVHVTRQISIVIEGAGGIERIARIQEGLRAVPAGGCLAGRRVTGKRDFHDVTRFGPFRSGTDQSARNLLSFELEGGFRALARPSGTEPKIKLYVEAIGAPLGAVDDAAVSAARAALEAALSETADALALEAYRLVGLEMPRFGLRLSPLLDLAHREDFTRNFVDELAAEAAGEGDLAAWADGRLERFGKDPRGLVGAAVRAWLASAGLPARADERVRKVFPAGS